MAKSHTINDIDMYSLALNPNKFYQSYTYETIINCNWMTLRSVKCCVAVMISSASSAMTDNRRWSSVVLGKIKSLWFTGGVSAMAGLNQLSGN